MLIQNTKTLYSRLNDLIEEQKAKSFTDPAKADKYDALGILVSQFCQWSPDNIFIVVSAMFEDSNMHDYNEKIEKMRQDWENKTRFKGRG
jgi:hypothetical protein